VAHPRWALLCLTAGFSAIATDRFGQLRHWGNWAVVLTGLMFIAWVVCLGIKVAKRSRGARRACFFITLLGLWIGCRF
jgi:hypothetical protein